MPPQTLAHLPVPSEFKQQFDESCWAACARFLIEFARLSGRSLGPVRSDSELGASAGSGCKSALAPLLELDFEDSADSAPVPRLKEILDDGIAGGSPLLCLVSADPPAGGKPVLEATTQRERHWIVIVGVDLAAKTIAVFDPAFGTVQDVPLVDGQFAYNHPVLDGQKRYFLNTSYIDLPKK